MAQEEHLTCANIIKDVHKSLRQSARKHGFDTAWKEHCSQKESLRTYAEAMKLLGSTYWEQNARDPDKAAQSRIEWITSACQNYFLNGEFRVKRGKEIVGCEKHNLKADKINLTDVYKRINVLDVGSCYNPFRECKFMNVLPIDLFPASCDVLQCDFLNVTISEEVKADSSSIQELAGSTGSIQELAESTGSIQELSASSYDAVIFSLLLEYLPHSSERKRCCEKAYKLLKREGILIIVTPDSKHVGANAKIFKTWRYTLALLGFSRVKYEKLHFLHCMVFRKCLSSQLARHWADTHREPYMGPHMHIPQDHHPLTEDTQNTQDTRHSHTNNQDSNHESTLHLFSHLPEL